MPLVCPENNLRKNAVPTPHAPFIRNAVTSKGTPQPPPMGRPLRGSTISNATSEGRIAPNRNAATQYHPWDGNLDSTNANTIPQTPPQNDKEKTAGTPNGLVATVAKGANGATPACHKIQSAS
ncbi:MAG: hypothetical protein WCA04_00505 [Geobacteraceae bacterium]